VCITVVRLATSRRAHRNDSFEQVHLGLSLTQFVDGTAQVVAILTFLDGDDTQGGIGEFIGRGKLGDTVMLVGGQLDFVFQPNDGRWREGFDVTLQVHVVLEGLAQPGTWHSDDGCEFDFQVDVAAITFADSVVGDTVVGAAILLVDRVDFQNVTGVGGAT
jgi:hypothetical protein